MTKILIIEDEPFIRENLEDILSLEGFETLAATDGLVGIQLAQQALPDLIICDIMMPYGDGYDVITALREAPQTEAIPFIFLTAKADRASLRQGMTLGADDYLTKPFTPQEVLESVRARLKKTTAQTQLYQNQIHHLSTELEFHRAHDALTGLPNRVALAACFQTLITRIRGSQQHLSLLYFTFDQLASIRAALGSDLSVALVQQLGQRLTTASQGGSMAYISDHQFAMVMGPRPTLSQAQAWAKAVAQVFDTPITLEDHNLFLIPKIGVAIYPQDGVSLDTLLLEAEMAATGLPEQGDRPVSFYSTDLHQQVKYRFAIEADLHHALDRQEIQVYYQPQIDLKTQTLAGAEALMRWFHPVRGAISPAHFIPIAEATDLIVPLGEWVLRTACEQVQRWPHYPDAALISVNLSPRQFAAPNLLTTITQVLAQTGLPPHRLELEITETVLMQDTSLVQHLLQDLKDSGIHIAIDDFGVGYSSFQYLSQFALSTLKIDRCFVHHLASRPKNQALVAAMIKMAHDLGLKVVAEGVEAEADLACLQSLECDIVQGYWYSPPLTAEAFEQGYAATPSATQPSLRQSFR